MRFEQCAPEGFVMVPVAHEKGKRMHQLHYRHPETGETVQVPNIWYNQPVEWRIEYMTFCRERALENAARKRAEGKTYEEQDALAVAARLAGVIAEMKRTGRALC